MGDDASREKDAHKSRYKKYPCPHCNGYITEEWFAGFPLVGSDVPENHDEDCAIREMIEVRRLYHNE